MLKQRKNKKQSGVPEVVATFANSVCEKQQRYGISALPPHMIIPLASGNGRSHTARSIARQYYEANALKFSSRDICLDFSLKETVQRVCEIDADIQTNSEYAGDFCGVITFDLDALIQRIRELPGNKFFELVAKIKKNATLIIFVPVDCTQNNIDYIAEKIGAGVKVFPPIMYSDEDFARLFYEFLPSEIVLAKSDDDFQNVKGHIGDRIIKTLRNKTIKNIKEAAEAIFYNDELRESIFGKSEKSKEIGGIVQ